MAVPTLPLHVQDPHDNIEEGGSSSPLEEEEEENTEAIKCMQFCCTGAARRQPGSSDRVSSSLHHHLLHDKRISQTSYPRELSPHTLLLLGEAAAYITMKPPAAAASLMIPNDPILAPLYTQLKSLKELIPAHRARREVPNNDESLPPSCLITHALDYIDHMNQQKQNLHEAILETFPSSEMDSKLGLVKVENLKESNQLQVHVQCIQRKGLLSSLLCTLENLGMDIEKMDVSYKHMFTLDVITSKVKLNNIDQKVLEQVLYHAISNPL